MDVPEFWMDRYEVTVVEYCDFLSEGGNDKYYNVRMRIEELCGIIKAGPGSYRVVPGRENYPVVFVNHDAAKACAESKGKTLPTEAMWESAARGLGGRMYPWGDGPVEPVTGELRFPLRRLAAGRQPTVWRHTRGCLRSLRKCQGVDRFEVL